MTDAVAIRQLPTGVPGLDAVLGGGLPEFSFNLIAGAPGTGKTTLAQQIMFALAEPERPALYFTVLGEPPVKMLRYQQQFTFFDRAEVSESMSLHSIVSRGGARAAVWSRILERIVAGGGSGEPRIVVVDSFRTVRAGWAGGRPGGPRPASTSCQRLGPAPDRVAGHDVPGRRIRGRGERENPVFTVADGLLWLYQSVDRNSVVRENAGGEVRGQASIPGLHTFRITEGGIQVFPRVIVAPVE